MRDKRELKTARHQLEEEASYDLEQAAVLRHGKIPQLEKN